jgi:hypothetical protein
MVIFNLLLRKKGGPNVRLEAALAHPLGPADFWLLKDTDNGGDRTSWEYAYFGGRIMPVEKSGHGGYLTLHYLPQKVTLLTT